MRQLTFGVPEFDGFVLTSRSKGLVVGAEGDAADLILMPQEGVQQLSLGVPKFDGFVPTSGSKDLSVGAKGDVDRLASMLGQPIALYKSVSINGYPGCC